ncbi:MAG: hypothetical protein NG740_05625 [Omnitrophica bacterium]|nr:hypothetical protein [Candidatus Omnitrophota bacterium]
MKILITYATAGVGHKKAAMAITKSFYGRYKNINTQTIDVLDYTNPFFKRTYCTTYLFLINKAVFLWGFFYYFLNLKVAHALFAPLRKGLHVLNGTRFINFLLKEKPEVVISTHFFTADICEYVKRKYGVSMRVMNVITDYQAHSFWISECVDTYVVGHERVKAELVTKWGVSEGKVEVFGIPVEEKFSKKHDVVFLRRKLGIDQDSFTVLLLSGGYGVGPFVRILRALNKAGFPLTAIAVCGHNKKLCERVANFKKCAAIKIINLGYVDNIDELMAVSSVCIGKAGGISTTEAIVQGVPFIFIRPIPGQERANADLFVKTGAALELRKISHILKTVESLKFLGERVKALLENIERAKKPNAAGDIATFAAEEFTKNTDGKQ